MRTLTLLAVFLALMLTANAEIVTAPVVYEQGGTKLEGFLTLNDREILQDAGKVSAKLAKAHAEEQYEEFHRQEDRMLESDFDLMAKQLPPPREGKE